MWCDVRIEEDREMSENATETRHILMVLKLSKSGKDILAELDPDKANLLHHAIGVAGEGGELLDAIKKHAIYNKPIDRVNIIEELGDLEFYMAGVREALAISREATLVANMYKLSRRYPMYQYSNQHAQDRMDKK